MKWIRGKKSMRVVEGNTLLSVLPDRPGPTQSVWDVMAACAKLAPGTRVALLGFAGGGIIAPLRAMGLNSRIEAVDLSRLGESRFRKVTAGWPGTVRLTRTDAARWLRGRKSRFDLIIEDLSIAMPSGVTKPSMSADTLPQLMKKRLTPGGVAVVNLLPIPGVPWRRLLERISSPYREVCWVGFDEYENRLMIGARSLPPARRVSLLIRSVLRSIGSRLSTRISVSRKP